MGLAVFIPFLLRKHTTTDRLGLEQERKEQPQTKDALGAEAVDSLLVGTLDSVHDKCVL